MQSTTEVRNFFSLEDVELDFASDDFQYIKTKSQFELLVLPILQKENPKVLIITAFEFI
jgi:hypothetical protein